MKQALRDYADYSIARFFGAIGIWYGRKYMDTNDINYGVKSIKYCQKCYDHYPDNYCGKGDLHDCLESMRSYVDRQLAQEV